MIIGFIGNLLAYIMPAGAAKWAARGLVILAIIGALYAAYSWAYDNGKDTERAKWEAAAEMLEDADAAADVEAIDVATATKKDINDANERAAAAASGSSDPLRDGLNSLRAEGSRKGD